MDTHIFEPIEVIAYFHGLQIDVIRFKWKETTYNISKLNSKWKIPLGNSYIYHFVVVCEKQRVICEISYNLNDFKWELVQLDMMQ